MPKLNLVLIVADQLNYRMLGCTGNRLIKTPNIDQLAARGTLLARNYCQAPLCMPSRSSFNSGLYPHAARVRHNPYVLPDDVTTLAERLRDAGYDTGGFGHLGGDGAERGFRTKVDLPDMPLRRAYCHEQELLQKEGHSRAAGTHDLHPMPLEEQFDPLATSLAVDFIQQTEQPFYAQLAFYKPHIPWYLSEPYASMYDPRDIPLPPTYRDELRGKPSNVWGTRRATEMEDYTAEELQASLAAYYGIISSIDDLVGKVVSALEAKGVLDNTVIMFTADHGDYAGEFGLVGKTGQFYDCLTHVPWIVSAPAAGVQEGASCDGLVGLVDLVPTALDLLGVERGPELQGQSRLDLLRDPAMPGADAVFCSTSGNERAAIAFDHVWDEAMLHPLPSDPYSSGPCSHVHDAVMVRDDCHKLCAYRDGGLELYDLKDDPWESTNLAQSPEMGGTVTRLLQRLLIWQIETWLPDRFQDELPYHYRAAAREQIPPSWHDAWDRWHAEHE